MELVDVIVGRSSRGLFELQERERPDRARARSRRLPEGVRGRGQSPARRNPRNSHQGWPRRERARRGAEEASAPGKPGSFNPIFGQFVPAGAADPDLLRGLVAYGLYKIAKQEWASALWKTENRVPTHDELAACVRTWTASSVEGARERAEMILADYASTVVEFGHSRHPEGRVEGQRLARDRI